MRFLATAMLALSISVAATPLSSPVRAGARYEKEIAGLKWPVLVHIPTNYSTDKQWPVLVYYHGTNGRPNLNLLLDHTGGKDFILLGMTYVRTGRFQYSEDNLKDEIVHCHLVLKQLARHIKMDNEQVYVGGFSKGGWVSAMFIDHDHRFAGGFVLGGGVYDRQLYKAEKFTTRTPVYIGVGEMDGNTIMSMNAKVHFRQLGAEVTLDIWPEIGHNWPIGKHRSGTFKQWLELIKLANTPDRGRAKMQAWLDEELVRVNKIDDLKDRYIALEKLLEMPATMLLKKPAKQKIIAVLTELRAEEPIATEWKVEQRYRKIVCYEMKDRQLKRLKTCCKGYLKLSQEFPDTIYGKKAEIDYRRTKHVIDYTKARIKQRKASN